MVEIKTFVKIFDNVNKITKWEGYICPIKCKHGFCLITSSPFRRVLILSNFIVLFMVAVFDRMRFLFHSILSFSVHFKTLNSACGRVSQSTDNEIDWTVCSDSILFYLPIMIAKLQIKDRVQVLSSFNFLRDQQLYLRPLLT